MPDKKDFVRNEILLGMHPHVSPVTSDILDKVIVKVLFNVDIVDKETGLSTRENTNEYIIERFNIRKAPKLSQRSVVAYLGTIDRLIRFMNKSLIDIKDMEIDYYLDRYAKEGNKGKGNKAVTVNNELRNISAFYDWMRKSRIVSENPCDNVDKYTEIEMPIDHLEDWEVEALRDACKIKVENKVTHIEEYIECLRDRALIEFLRSTAVRVGECVSVNWQDIDFHTGSILVYGEKGKAYRTVCLDEMARWHVKKYIDSRTDTNPALFVGARGNKERLQTSGVRAALKVIKIRSGLKRRVYPHLFRKTTASNMAKKGCPGELIALYLGHKNANVTNKHYAHRSPEMVKNAFFQYGAA